MAHVASGPSVNGSSQAGDTPVVFNLTNESDVLALLRSIHRGTLKQKVKNDLRDLLLGFKQGASADHAVVIATLAEAGFKATYEDVQGQADSAAVGSVVNEPPAAAVQKLGRVRSAPRFAAVAPQPVSAPIPKVEPAPIPVAPSSVPVEEKPIAPVVPPPVAAPTPIPPPAPEVVAAPVVPPPPPPVAADPMERIKEIKRIVAEKVGNPITLLDANNQVGREYMNALLAAMKTANGGRPDEVIAAMARLEKAYLAAIDVAKNAPPPETPTDKFVKATNPSAVAPAPAPVSGFEKSEATPAAPVAPVPVSAPVAPAPVPPPIPSEPPTAPAASAFETVATPQTPVAPTPVAPTDQSAMGEPVKIRINSASLGITADSGQETMTEPAPVVAEAPQSVSVVNKMSAVGTSNQSIPPMNEAAPIVPTPSSFGAAAVPTGAATAQGARLLSVAKEEQLQNLLRQNQMQAVTDAKKQDEQMRASGDPLLMPEVTAGLKQLLSEWSLFKSSGFFGTGPGGVDHPLYKQMSGLTMAAVIAGRFEGATSQVKQSITDYMNGWRYEEGIVHEHTETFEHYLRRVIKHILDNKDLKR